MSEDTWPENTKGHARSGALGVEGEPLGVGNGAGPPSEKVVMLSRTRSLPSTSLSATSPLPEPSLASAPPPGPAQGIVPDGPAPKPLGISLRSTDGVEFVIPAETFADAYRGSIVTESLKQTGSDTLKLEVGFSSRAVGAVADFARSERYVQPDQALPEVLALSSAYACTELGKAAVASTAANSRALTEALFDSRTPAVGPEFDALAQNFDAMDPPVTFGAQSFGERLCSPGPSPRGYRGPSASIA